MPPSYKPLQAGIQGLPESLFSAAPISFEDAQKQQALARAQELANQMQEQNVRKNEALIGEQQRQLQQESQLRDALVSQYGGGNVDMNSLDPDAALITAQKIALQSGDLNTAMAIEKTQRERRAAKAEQQPLSKEMLDYFSSLNTDKPLPIPAGATLKDLTAGANLQKTRIYGQSVSENIDKRKDETASLAPGGWQSIVDPVTGQGPTKDDGKKFTVAVNAHKMLTGYMDQLEASLNGGQGNDPTDPEYLNQRQLIASMQVALKKKNEFGAALTANEQLINDNILPLILARSDVGMKRALVEAGLGRTPQDAMRNLRRILDGELQVQAELYKFARAGGGVQPAMVSGAISRSGVGGAPERPGMTYQGTDQATGLPIYKKSK